MSFSYEQIGIIHTPFNAIEEMPIQPAGAKGVDGTIEIFDPFRDGLKDLDGFSHIYLLYHFHLNDDYKLDVIPFLDKTPRGVFSTRAPRRPNPIGLSVVELARVEGSVLHVRNIDVLDGTPLVDIKPYVPKFDAQQDVRTGWIEASGNQVSEHKSDDRFG